MPYGGSMVDANAESFSRRNRNKQRTRVRILDAARQLFTEKGVAATTIEELADVADVARATFFNYFPSKIAVVEEILDIHDDSFFRGLAAELERDIPTKALLEGFFAASARAIEGSPKFFRVMIAESEKTQAGFETDRDRYLVMTTQFKKVIDRGVVRGDVRTDYPPDLLAEILVGAYATVLRSWRGRPGYALVDRLTQAASAMGDFLSPPQGKPQRRKPAV
jgi:AcrR family transcriptional regulator